MLRGEGYFKDVRKCPYDSEYKLLGGGKGKKRWAPWEVVVLLVAIFTIYHVISTVYHVRNIFNIFFGIILILASSVIIAVYLMKLVRWYEEERDKRKSPEELECRRLELEKWESEQAARREKRYLDWLVKNYGLARRTGAVDLDDIPAPLGFGERVVQIFQVSFWSMKAKVCRPYSR